VLATVLVWMMVGSAIGLLLAMVAGVSGFGLLRDLLAGATAVLIAAMVLRYFGYHPRGRLLLTAYKGALFGVVVAFAFLRAIGPNRVPTR
jgi:hypothetical protein